MARPSRAQAADEFTRRTWLRGFLVAALEDSEIFRREFSEMVEHTRKAWNALKRFRRDANAEHRRHIAACRKLADAWRPGDPPIGPSLPLKSRLLCAAPLVSDDCDDPRVVFDFAQRLRTPSAEEFPQLATVVEAVIAIRNWCARRGFGAVAVIWEIQNSLADTVREFPKLEGAWDFQLVIQEIGSGAFVFQVRTGDLPTARRDARAALERFLRAHFLCNPRGPRREHLNWLALWQFEGCSAEQIAKRHQTERYRDHKGIRRAVGRTAATLGIALAQRKTPRGH